MLLHGLDDDEALTRVAGPRLEELVKESQLNDLNSTKPRVKPVGENPLRSPAQSRRPLRHRARERSRGTTSCSARSSVGAIRSPRSVRRCSPNSRWASGTTSESPAISCSRSGSMSRLDFQPEAAVTIVPFADGGSAPVDLVWRVDIAGPMPRAAIHLWSERHGRRHRQRCPRRAPPTPASSPWPVAPPPPPPRPDPSPRGGPPPRPGQTPGRPARARPGPPARPTGGAVRPDRRCEEFALGGAPS